MLQDFSCPADQEVEGDMPSIPVVHKSGIRSLKLEMQEVLPDCYLTHRRSPSYEVEKMEMSGTEGLFELECKKSNLLSSVLLVHLLVLTKIQPVQVTPALNRN
jgi:hypothetical protein